MPLAPKSRAKNCKCWHGEAIRDPIHNGADESKPFSRTSEEETWRGPRGSLTAKVSGDSVDIAISLPRVTSSRETFSAANFHSHQRSRSHPASSSPSSPLPIRQSAPVSVSSPSSMAPEPVGQNHLSAAEEGQPDMLQPLEQCTSTVPLPRLRTETQTSSVHTFTPSQCQSERCCSAHKLLLIPVGPHTVTLPKFLNVPGVFFFLFFIPSSICFACFFDFACQSPSHSPSPLALTCNIFFSFLFLTAFVCKFLYLKHIFKKVVLLYTNKPPALPYTYLKMATDVFQCTSSIVGLHVTISYVICGVGCDRLCSLTLVIKAVPFSRAT